MNQLFSEIKNLINFFTLKKNKKRVVFYSESIFYKNYYIDFFFEIKKKIPGVVILTSDLKEYYFLKKENIDIYFIGNGVIRLLIFNFIKCDFFIMTMTDIGNNLKKSKFCNNYVYFFHCQYSTHIIYTPKAFDNYDIIFTIGNYHQKEIRKNEEIYNLKKKVLINIGYFYLDYLKRNANLNISKKNQVLFAPSWNYNEKNLFNDHGINLIKTLTESNFKVSLRPHPEIIKRNKKNFTKLVNSFVNSKLFYLDQNPSNLQALERASILITDNSSIGIEFSLVFKRPVLYIDYSKKIHNENYKKINLVPLEELFKETIGFTINSSQINQLPKICSDILNKPDELKDKISEFEKENFSNIGYTPKKAADFIFDYNA